jgi:nucleoid DNA-binding protein
MKKNYKKKLKELSLNNYVPEKEVEEIIKSQFHFVKTVIEQGEHDNIESMKSIKLLSFGTFRVNDRMVAHIITNKNKKNGNNNT